VVHGGGEGGEVDLPECALGDDDVNGGREPVEDVAVTLDLLVVRRVVLHLRDDVSALKAAHLGRGDLPGEEWVLAQRLRGASPERGAGGVDGRAEEEGDALRGGLVADRDTEARREGGVPRGGEPRCVRDRGAGLGAVADAVRSIGRRQGRDAEPWNTCTAVGDERDLLV